MSLSCDSVLCYVYVHANFDWTQHALNLSVIELEYHETSIMLTSHYKIGVHILKI